MKIIFSEQSVALVEQWFPKTIFILIGILFLILTAIFWKNLQQHRLQWIVGGFGILFVLGGLLLLLSKLNIKINISDKGIFVSEKKFGKHNNLQFDWNTIQQLEILPSVYNQSKQPNSNQTSTDVQLEVNLRFKNGSLLFLETFTDMNKATNFIQHINKINLLKTVLLLPEEYEKNNTYQSVIQNLKPVNPIVYTNPDSIFLNAKNTAPIITIENTAYIKCSTTNNEQHYFWSGRRSIISFTLFSLLAITFLFIIFKVVIPDKGYNILSVIGIIVGSIITLVSLFSLVFAIGGRYHLELQNEKLVFRSEWFGKSINTQEVNYSNILHIRNSFNSSSSSDIIILTPTGYDNLIKPVFRKASAPDLSMLFNTVLNYKNNMLIMTTYGLSMKDKLFLENKIREKLVL